LFMGGMAKAISDIIIKQILPNIQPATKRCSHCNSVNNSIANYCYQCGNRFERIS
jgi:predicted amidophosphoribosyltransferase